jgi:WD40 repeat protein
VSSENIRGWMNQDEHAGGELFSETLVRSYVDDTSFVERPWLADLIEEKLADAGCRFLLLTGEPGSGKTALTAWLARRNPDWPRYFIRRDSRVPLNSGDARSLLFALGHQLAALHPALFHPEKLDIVVRQHFGEIAPGGRAAGIRVEDLAVSPFYGTALRVEQRADVVAGELTGIAAGRLVAEERFLELSNLQYLALLDPAAVLMQEDPRARLVILIDALDELRYSPAGESALDWLATCPELPANVGFLLTSRPDRRLLEVFRRRQAEWLRETAIDADPAAVEVDLARYATTFAAQPAVERALAAHEITSEDFVAGAVARADLNFQYLAALFRAIEQVLAAGYGGREPENARDGTLRRLIRLEELPAGLGELYGFFLSLIRDAVAGERVAVPGATPAASEHLPAWEGLYQPVLGVLAVAREPLTLRQISHFGAIETEERWLRAALARLGQFLDGDERGYRLYHASLPEYATAEETAVTHPDDYLDPGEWHRKIALAALAAFGEDWLTSTDDYALAHTPAHLAAAIRAGGNGIDPRQDDRHGLRGRLEELLTDVAFLERKAARLGIDSLLVDLDEAAEHIGDDDSRVRQLDRVLHLEAHDLRRWDAERSSSFFAQQLRNRAKERGMLDVLALADDRLRTLAGPFLALEWSAGQEESSGLERTLAGHRGAVTALAEADDGEHVVSGSTDKTVKLWKLGSGEELRSLTGHGDDVRAVAVTRDGRKVIAASRDTIKTWDLRRGDELRTLAIGGDYVALAPERQLAVSASPWSVGVVSQSLEVWDLARGRQASTLAGAGEMVTALAVTRDGARAVSSSGPDQCIKVWDLEAGAEIRTVMTGDDWHTALAITPDGRRAVSGSRWGPLKVWDLDTGQELHHLAGHEDWVTGVAVTPDGRWAVSASHDKTIRLWSLETGEELETLRGHHDAVEAVAVTPDRRRAISGSQDGILKVWDLTRNEVLEAPTGHQATVGTVAVTPDGRCAISGAQDGSFKVWDLKSGSELLARSTRRGSVEAVAVTPDGRRGLFGFILGEVAVWDLETGEELLALKPHTGAVTAVAVTPDGRRAVSGSRDETLKIWNLEDGTGRRALGREEPESRGEDTGMEGVAAVAVTPDGKKVVAGLVEGSLKVWDLESGAQLHYLGYGSTVAALRVTSKQAVSLRLDGSVTVWDLDSGERLEQRAGNYECKSAALTPDARRTVCATADGVVRIRNVQTGEAAEVVVTGEVASVAISPDVHWVVCGGAAGSVRCLQLSNMPS